MFTINIGKIVPSASILYQVLVFFRITLVFLLRQEKKESHLHSDPGQLDQ